MGLFDRLFGKKKKIEAASTPVPKPASSPQKAQKKNYFFTNAQDFNLGEIQLGISGKMRIDGLLGIAEMEKIAKARGVESSFSVLHTTLLEEGALTVPVVCTIGEERYSLYFIYKEEELLKYRDLVKHIDKTSYPNLIYFSSIPVNEGLNSKPIIEPFQLADLRVDLNAKIAGQFSMWWSSEEDPLFHLSKSFEYLKQLNELMNGYETYMTGYVLRQTRIVSELELKRMRLPEQNATYVLNAPEGKKVLLDLSQEKGIRFLFPIEDTSKEYRERFLRGAMVDFAANIISLKQNNLPIDEKIEPNSYDWFSFMSRTVTEKEKSKELIGHKLGVVNYNAQSN